MSNYSRGATFENAVKKDMEHHGYHAIRAAGSHTPADIYCISRSSLVYIQCKTNGVLGVAEWNAFLDYCSEVGAVPVLAEKIRGGILYHEITGRKDGTRKKQPMKEWTP